MFCGIAFYVYEVVDVVDDDDDVLSIDQNLIGIDAVVLSEIQPLT